MPMNWGRRPSRVIAVAGMATLLSAANAGAQTTTLKDEVAAGSVGYKLGSFTLVPQVVLTGTWESNVNRTDTGDKADYQALLAAIASFQSKGKAHELNINLGGGVRRYRETEALDGETYAAGVNGHYDVSNTLTLNGDVSAQRDLIGPGNIERALGGSNAVNLTQQASGGFRYTSLPLIVAVNASYMDRQNRNASNAGSGSISRVRFDRSMPSVNGTVTLALGPAFAPFVTAAWQDIGYEDSTDPFAKESDSTGVQYQVGVNFALAQNFGGTAQVGVNSQDYTSALLGTRDVVIATVGTQWMPTEGLVVRGGYNRAYNEIRVPMLPVPGFITEGFQLSAEHTGKTLTLTGSLTLADITVISAVPLPPPFPAKVDAKQFELRLGGTYTVSEALRLKAEGVVEERSSKLGLIAYDNQGLSLSVLYAF